MKHIPLPEAKSLPFYLAAEEWVARHMADNDDYLFGWQAGPAVICGRNQNVAAEIDLAYCRDNGIEVYRRKSGGGAVFADMSNIMFSYITPSDGVETTFSRYTSMMTDMLRSLGLNATAGGRNDIYVDGLKVAGNAFYHIGGRAIVHGTMLYDTDPVHMGRALTPSRAKLESKGVHSVESRITTLSGRIAMSAERLRSYAIGRLTDGEAPLPADAIDRIGRMARAYTDSNWIYGSSSRRHNRRKVRIEGVGEIELWRGAPSDGTVGAVEMTGDFFPTGDLDSLLRRVATLPATHEALTEALADTDVGRYVRGLSTAAFIDLIV